jgi:hypothetical protein
MAGPASIIGVQALRVGRLTADGTPDFNNPVGGFMLRGGVSPFEHDFEVEEGADIFEEDAAGNACVVRKKFDRVKRATFTLTVCRKDYRLDEILAGADAVTLGGTTVGQAVLTSAGCGTGVQPKGVSLELWSEQWDCDVPLVNQPYQRVILPRCFLTPSGFTRENGVSMPQYTGFSIANNAWGDGPWGDADVMVGHTGWCYAEIDDVAVPAAPTPIGYVGIPGSAS